MSTENQDQIKLLKNKIAQIESRMSRFTKFFQNDDNKSKLEEIENRFAKTQPCLDEYENIYYEISVLDPNEINENEIIEFEDNYYKIISEVKTHIKKSHQNSTNKALSVSSNSNDGAHQVKLPNIHLPSFSGLFTEWVTFRDTYQSLIHNSSTLMPIEKFHYLKSCLKSTALQTIEHLTLSDSNYEEAWQLLKSRFENKRLITQHHIRAIFALPTLTKDSKTVRQLLHGLTTNMKTLESIGRPVKHWDDVLVHLITTKFDYQTTMSWENNLNHEPPTVEKLTEFLTQRCEMLESIEINNAANKQQSSTNYTNQKFNKPNKFSYGHSTSHFSTEQAFNSCVMCKQSHKLYRCKNFLSLPVNQRLIQVKKHNLCQNCLCAGHIADKCFLGSCKHCNNKHNSLLHQNTSPTNNVSVQNPEITQQQIMDKDNNNSVVTAFCENHIQNTVVLSTALIEILDQNNKSHICRALIDSGSQSNFITKDLCNKLNLELNSINISVTGISQSTNKVIHKTQAKIKSRTSSFSTNLECLVLDKITSNLPPTKFSISALNFPSNIRLADPHFNKPGNIDVLLGAEIFWELLSGDKMETNIKHLYLQNTKLGFIVGGKVNTNKTFNNTVCNLVINSLDAQLSKFWDIENYEDQKPLGKDEHLCENHFNATVSREPSGRFIVQLPFRENPPDLGSSKQSALKRFMTLENKFKRDPSLELQYKAFISEYKLLEHLESLTSIELEKLHNTNSYYLPHHAVFKNSTTTKLRVVFDGSCPTSNGKSLNDNLLVGPTLQQNLFDILARFRIYQYVISGDIAKMYRQVLVHPHDRNYQLILWRDQPHEPIETYRLKTVTYGLSSSSYLAIKCLQELALENSNKYPESYKIILNDFYVDDMLTGASSIEDLLKIKEEVTAILSSGGFELRKFMSNSLQLSDNDSQSQTSVSLDMQPQNKTLGLLWHHSSDSIKYSINTSNFSNAVTKRQVLSIISSLFDPLGLASPITIVAKIILQEIWSLKINWDEEIPDQIKSKWTEFLNSFIQLNDITIPRKIIINESYITIEMHGFSDSSQNAYGACIYLRAIYANGEVTSNLLCSKSRVAPLKTITIPRLELLAAVLLTKLVNAIKQGLNLNIDKIIYWTDSTIVLSWIKLQPNTLKTFVANRISTIQSLTSSDQWKHISSQQNPADIVSRGTTPELLKNNKLWWHGPEFLTFKDIPYNDSICNTSELPETKSSCCLVATSNDENDLQSHFLSNYSTWLKTLRVTAYIIRFIKNSQNPKHKITGPLLVDEIQNAHNNIIKIIQMESFSEDIHFLKKHGETSKNSKLKSLHTYLDKEGLLRVGGRLRHASISLDQKHQIILPKNHHITHLIIKYHHVTQMHSGCQATIAALRQKYWIVSCRSVVRKTIFKCVKCFKLKPISFEQLMGDLPEARITPSRPFTYTAVDYAGPIIIKNGHGRTTKTIKSYIALFVCFSTKAIHLELVCDCTSSTFMNALKRFMSRRGKVHTLYSDNGTNFVGANRELKNLFKSNNFKTDVVETLANEHINWQFIPAKSPHMNGLAEAAVKSTKFHLKRVLNNNLLNYEEMYTILTMIEACLNSRPLTTLSNDPSDLIALTPGHFLIGDALTAPAEPDLSQVPQNRLSRYQLLEQLRQHFWTRWSREYLHQLQQRSKWHKARQPPEVGTLVLLQDDNLPPQHWILGRIQSHHPSADNLVRTVTVKTVRGVKRRAINKICPLPCE